MTAIMSIQTRKQTEAFGAFIAAVGNLKTGFEQAAHIYKTCIDEGCNMAPDVLEEHGVPRALTFRLAKIAEGKLLPALGYRLLGAPNAVVEVACNLPKDLQQKLMENGVEVYRSNAAALVPIEHVMRQE